MIYIDFETRSEVNLLKTGAWKYAQSATTKPLCLAWAIKDGPIQLWKLDEDMPGDLKYYIEYGFNVEAHNAGFERAIWRNIMTPRFGWPGIPDNQWRCSASFAAAHAIPRSLEWACIAMDTEFKKNKEGHAIMMKMCKPRKALKSEDPSKVYWHESPEDFATLYNYCVDDVRAERSLSHSLAKLSPQEHKVWLLDQKINERGLRMDVEAVESAIQLASEYKAQLNKRLEVITKGRLTATTQNVKLLELLQKCGLKKMKSIAAPQIKRALKSKKLPPKLREILVLRQQGAKTSTAKYNAVAKSICSDGRVRDTFMYHGAGTGRWTGKGLQPHNLPQNRFRGDKETFFEILKMRDLEAFQMMYGNVLDNLSWNIRGSVIPSEGKSFFGGDYSSIEARVLVWMAGDKRALDLFWQDKDVYVDMARKIYGVTEVTTLQREMGKRTVLGCGYGMGWETFIETCATYGVTIDEEFAKRVIKAYRRLYVMVVQMWKDQEAAVLDAVKSKCVIECGKVSWGVRGEFLYCKLPSGRRLAYNRPEIHPVETPWGEMKDAVTYMHMDSYTKKWERTSTYGGKIVENIAQAAARDLLANAMLNCEDAGYEVVLHVHDEAVAEKENGTVEEFEKLMSKKPEWAEEIPVTVEGWTGRRYLK